MTTHGATRDAFGPGIHQDATGGIFRDNSPMRGSSRPWSTGAIAKLLAATLCQGRPWQHEPSSGYTRIYA
jgi:hypothetical protein